MLRIAPEYGDAWSSWGGYDVETEEDFYAVTAERSHRFDDLCVDAGRDPSTIRHSLVCFPPLTPWQSVEYFRDMVGRPGQDPLSRPNLKTSSPPLWFTRHRLAPSGIPSCGPIGACVLPKSQTSLKSATALD